MHIQLPEERKWIQERVEKPHEKMDHLEQLRILRRLNAAEAFEKFLHTKYIGQKRFSLEGSESAIVALDSILVEAANDNLVEVDIAMPHRGRLNVLARRFFSWICARLWRCQISLGYIWKIHNRRRF
jgi:2-oxoglutarate dehydrogenase E1 component